MVIGIDRSTSFLQHPETHALTDAGHWDEAWVYARYANPTVAGVESKLADLEGARGSLLFSSGQAAMGAALFASLEAGAPVAAAHELYGGTVDLLEHGLKPRGHALHRFPVGDLEQLDRALEAGARLVLVESLSNPAGLVADLPQIAARVRAKGARLLVDATFATPALQRPLELGADIVMHSGTKAISGHSDVTAGVLSTNDQDLVRALWSWRKRLGSMLDPNAAFLLERGLKTLFLRVQAKCAGACAVAAALDGNPKLARVHHPSLPSHPGHRLAAELLDGPGSVVTLELKAGDEALRPFVARLQLASDAPSLGGVETLVSLPRFMSHTNLNAAERLAAGIQPGTVRLAVGIEHPNDLIADLRRALG